MRWIRASNFSYGPEPERLGVLTDSNGNVQGNGQNLDMKMPFGDTVSIRYVAAPSGLPEYASIFVGGRWLYDSMGTIYPGPYSDRYASYRSNSVIVRTPELDFVSEADGEPIATLPVSSLDALLSRPVAAGQVFRLVARIPTSGAGASLTATLRGKGYYGKELPVDGLFPPVEQSIVLTRHSQDYYRSEPLLSSVESRVLTDVPSLPYKVIRAGPFVNARFDLPALAEVQQQAEAALQMTTDPELPEVGEYERTKMLLVNGRVNLIWKNGQPKPKIKLRLTPVAGVLLTGTQVHDGALPVGNFLVPAGVVPSFSNIPSKELAEVVFQCENPGLTYREATLKITADDKGKKSEAEVKIRVVQFAAELVVTYIIVTEPDEVLLGGRHHPNNHVDLRHEQTNDIWRQAGIVFVKSDFTQIKTAEKAFRHYTDLIAVDTAKANTFFGNLAKAAYTNEALKPRITIFLINTIQENSLNMAGFVPSGPMGTTDPAIIPNFILVTRTAVTDLSGVPTGNHVAIAHELGHILGLNELDHPTDDHTQNQNSLMRSYRREANMLVEDAKLPNGTVENQFTRSRKYAVDMAK
jgi:hypothetical protein